MNILISGASGFVGKFFCSSMLSKEHKLYVINSKNPDAILMYRNIKFDALIHLAARAHVMNENVNDVYSAYAEVNINYTKKITNIAKYLEVKRFVFISSIKVNGESTSNKPFSELDDAKPQDDYGITKFEAEKYLSLIANDTEMEFVIIRAPLVYGRGVKANFFNLIKLCQKKILLPFGAINNKRSLIYIENLVDFILLCTHHPKAANETFVIADGDDVSTTDLIKVIREASGNRPRLIPIPQTLLVWLLKCLGKHALATRLCGNLQIDITKAKTLLGWKPPYTFKEGIARTMQDQVK